MQKQKVIRLVSTSVILLTLAVLWGRESDLAYNVAQQRPILLGRYTLEHTITLLFATPILLVVLRRLWKKKGSLPPEEKRIRLFKRISLTVSVLLALGFADMAMRLVAGKKTYVGDEESYHRIPDKVYQGVFQDRPEFPFSYPFALPGNPDVPYVLTVDDQGFRNPVRHDSYDWIVLGDSFAEGSSVSDEHVWVARLAGLQGVTICNLGMSGGSPVTYLDTLEKFGVGLNPKVALYMLYEGNDLRDSNFRRKKLDAPKKVSLSARLFKLSPLRRLLKDSLNRMLGPVGSGRYTNDPSVHHPEHKLYPVAWLPLEVPAGSGQGYAFDVKRLEQHGLTEAQFRRSIAFRESLRLLDETRALCEKNGIRLIVLYAPDTPNVLIEEILGRIPPAQLHAFMATRMKRLPEPGALAASLHSGTQVRESVFREFCRDQNIPFLSLTEPLRKKTLEGVRTYYTYDQHWTPDGHAVIAEWLNEQIPAVLRNDP